MSRRVSPEREKQITRNIDALLGRMENHDKEKLLRVMLIEYRCGHMDNYSGYIDMGACHGLIQSLCDKYSCNHTKDFVNSWPTKEKK